MSDYEVKFEVPSGVPPHPDESFTTEDVAFRVAGRHEDRGSGYKATVWKDGVQIARPV